MPFSCRIFPNDACRGWGVALGLLLVGVASEGRTADVPKVPADPPSVAFNPRSGPRGRTLFTTLTPEQTGITAVNAYDDPKMWGELYHEFNSGAIGTGVAIGDFDGDGLPDIFVVSKTGRNHLYRNLGGMRFEDVTERAGVGGPVGPWKQGAAFVDVNNDGLLDIYVCRFGAPNLLYINQGDGTFKEEAAKRGLALTDASGMAAFSDYDRDGWLDVLVQTNLLDAAQHPEGQRNHLFHNNRDGTFTEVTEASGISGRAQGHSATWWDYDEDGWPDLYISNDFQEPDKLYHNNHDGTFTDVISAVVPHMPHFSMGADLADLNNDGHLDMLVADMPGSTRYADHRGMAKLRSALPSDDLYPRAAPQYMQNALYLGTGTGRVLEAAHLAGLQATDWTFSVLMEDLDLDGRVDAYFTNGMAREFNNSDLVQRALAASSTDERIRIMKMSPQLAQRHRAFRNMGDLRFEDVSAAWGLDHVGIGFGAAFGDLDGDGDLDLVFTNYDGQVTVCRNDSDSAHSVAFLLRGVASNRFGIGATVRIVTKSGPQMRTLTLARGYLSTSEPIVLFGLGAEAVIKKVTVDWPSGRQQTYVNLPADRRYTITETSESAPAKPAKPEPQFADVTSAARIDKPNRESPESESREQALLPFRFNRPGPSLVCADFDGDGEDDLAVGGVSGDPGRLYSNVGGGVFIEYGRKLFVEHAEIEDGPMLAFDALGDGRQDVLVTKAGTAAAAGSGAYQPHLFINDGHGQFSPAAEALLPTLPISVGAVAAADFEHSGRLGIFVGGRIEPGHYPKVPRSALLAWRGDRYVDVAPELAPALANGGMVTAAIWADVDGDGWPDLIVTYDWGRTVCYRNRQGKALEDETDVLGFGSAGAGWWSSIASADFNGDGRPDFVVGNVGLNTRYHASPSEPALLYEGVSLDASGPQLIEAQYDSGKLYPLRTRDALIGVFPTLARRFPTYESYARATLADVFPGGALSKATKHSATEFRSGVFLSQPDGTYRFTPLPRLAQIAPVHGIVTGDFDGDGNADIILVGNSYSPIPETGRFDGGLGLMLRGDGKGGFDVVPPAESGIVVPGDARALGLSDLNRDGWPDLVVTRNNDTPLLLANRGVAKHHSFGVALQGAPGNPTAVGAVLTLSMGDGSRQTAGIFAGSGYFTQSSPTAFFAYSDSNPPTHLAIRWPDGQQTEQAIDTHPPGLLRISDPLARSAAKSP